MLKPGQFAACVLILLVGCSTAPREVKRSYAPLQTATVARAPSLAPPPSGPPGAGPPTAAAPPWISLEEWSRQHHEGGVRRLSMAPLPTFALAALKGAFIFQANSSIVRWDGLELHLGFAARLVNGALWINELDVEKNIEPLMEGFALPPKPHRVVVIDPGHGGSNLGARSAVDGHYEKEFTLDWARRLAPLLAADGWEVFLTRTNDVDVSLPDRVAFAEAHHADLFLSLHFNAAPGPVGPTEAGMETYCLTPAGMPSTLTRGYPDDVTAAFPNNAFDTENLQYAARLQQALLQVPGALDHGVRRARFMGVLRGQTRPAVLIEGGYLSNPREARRIADPDFREELAQAVAHALAGPVVVQASAANSGPAGLATNRQVAP